MAEYAARYGGPPSGDESWALFMALARRANRFDARRKLIFLTSIAANLSSMFGGDYDLAGEIYALRADAFPGTPKEKPLIENAGIADA